MSFICIYSMKIKEFKLYSDKGHITPLNSENLGGGGILHSHLKSASDEHTK